MNPLHSTSFYHVTNLLQLLASRVNLAVNVRKVSSSKAVPCESSYAIANYGASLAQYAWLPNRTWTGLLGRNTKVETAKSSAINYDNE